MGMMMGNMFNMMKPPNQMAVPNQMPSQPPKQAAPNPTAVPKQMAAPNETAKVEPAQPSSAPEEEVGFIISASLGMLLLSC